MSIDQINFLLSLFTIIGQVGFVLLGLKLLFARNWQLPIVNYFNKNALQYAFVIALVAMLSSLYYSQIAHFTPCNLCWYQRIFMYPQVFLLGLALLKKDDRIIDYSLLISAIGTSISLYHNYIYYTAKVSNFCGLVSCTERYIVGFGYLSIPLMALTGFLLLDLLLISRKISAC